MNPAAGIPLLIGLSLGGGLYWLKGWYGFLILFPWIGASVSMGIYLRLVLARGRKHLGRKISILLILPALLFFVPLANKENLQLEGIIFLVLIGFWGKGIIHYAIAKVVGPLIWGRGFCGWACWTAAVLEWLPTPVPKQPIPAPLKNIRFFSLALSISIPLLAVYPLHYDIRQSYLFHAELQWMLAGNAIYYFLAIPLALCFGDKRAFCKIACPVSLIMKIPARYAGIRRRPSTTACISCGKCNQGCPMDVDIMSAIAQGKPVMDTECILCDECTLNCPVGAIR